MTNQVKFSLHLGRASVIYAEEMFTVYITVENISNETLYIWDFGILRSAEFVFHRGKQIKKIPISLTGKLKRFISNIRDFVSKKAKEEIMPLDKDIFTDEQVKQKSKEDFLKVFYFDQFGKKKRDPPLKLSPGESHADSFFGRTHKFLTFRPDKYLLMLWVDYSTEKDEFIREVQVESVDVLASIKSIVIGAIIGGLMGATVRIFSKPYDVRTLVELLGSVILSVLAVIALSRKTGAQTLITIQDFWGGILVGFLVGYSGKTFFEQLMGITSTTPSS